VRPLPRAVYVAALNRTGVLEELGEALHRDPYQQPPRAPILHVKPANTWSESGEPIPCPPGVAALRMGGTIGLVIGREARRVRPASALDHVASYLIANDVSIPYQSHYRPAIKERCRDGFCPLGSVVPRDAIPDPDRLEVVIEVDGVIRSRSNGSDLIRGAARLLAEVSAFLTFAPGDVVLLGEPPDAPLAGHGSTVRIAVAELGEIVNPIVPGPE